MKLGLQLGMIPGKTVKEKQQWARDHGVEGIEVSARDYPLDRLDQLLRDFEDSPVPVVSICGNPTFDFLDPDPQKRRASMEQSKAYLKACGALGGVGQIVPPIFGPPRINDLSPWKDAVTLEKELLVVLCQELGDVAGEHGVYLMLEPLNRYEQHLLRRQQDAVEIIERCRPRTSASSATSSTCISKSPTRRRPSARWGDTSPTCILPITPGSSPAPATSTFVPDFEALADVGFQGYMVYECGISGDDKEASLIKSLEYLRGIIQEVTRK